jgi:cell division protein FtsN
MGTVTVIILVMVILIILVVGGYFMSKQKQAAAAAQQQQGKGGGKPGSPAAKAGQNAALGKAAAGSANDLSGGALKDITGSFLGDNPLHIPGPIGAFAGLFG